ncbi:MAG: galactonate dehydratase [Bryobacteraceae bacterium]
MNRRDFLAASALPSPLFQDSLADPAGPRYTGSTPLKITGVKPFLVYAGRTYVYVKVTTDQGIHGWGEAYSAGPDEATAATIRDFENWLVGKDPRNIEYLWATMYNFTRFPGGLVVNAAISGIEQALWDIAGKAAGLPVYMLLGGKCRDKIRVYQSAGGSTPEQLAENARQLVAKYGYTAIKSAPHPSNSQSMPFSAVLRAARQRSEALRKALGPDVDLCFDAHATIWEPYRALEMAEVLKPVRPLFLEEPIRMENMDALASLRHKAQVPIATGECLYTKFEFRRLLATEAADIVQPDICLAGGVLEQKKIAAIAEAHYVKVAPHNPLGPLATLVNVHFAASTPNFLILEYQPDDRSPRRDLIKGDPILVKDGYLPVPDKPGWGYEMDEEAFKRMPGKPWHRGFAFAADGAPDFI